MSTCTSSDSFESAVSYLSNSPALSGVSNNVKLELYALYKCITVSPRPQTSRPSLFDFTGRAKWDTWHKLGRESENTDPNVWKTRYLEIARSLGWSEDSQTKAVSPTNDFTADDLDDLSPSSSDGSGGGGGGMGAGVSIVLKPPPSNEDVNCIHGFALSGDAEGLAQFLNAHPELDLNIRDSYGYTALHLAADRGHESVVNILLERGVDTSLEDPDEFTALGLAEISGHENVISLLKENGAS